MFAPAIPPPPSPTHKYVIRMELNLREAKLCKIHHLTINLFTEIQFFQECWKGASPITEDLPKSFKSDFKLVTDNKDQEWGVGGW